MGQSRTLFEVLVGVVSATLPETSRKHARLHGESRVQFIFAARWLITFSTLEVIEKKGAQGFIARDDTRQEIVIALTGSLDLSMSSLVMLLSCASQFSVLNYFLDIQIIMSP